MNELPKMPEFKASKNGYEIRTDILAMAKNLVETEYNYKYDQWRFNQKKDEKTGEIVTTVEMPPFPGLEEILKTAEQMYNFVNFGNHGHKNSDKKSK